MATPTDPKPVQVAAAPTPPLPPSGHALAAIGPETERVVLENVGKLTTGPLFEKQEEVALKQLAVALAPPWNDANAARVLREYFGLLQTRYVEPTSLIRWVTAHPNGPESAVECLKTEPPEQLTINRVLSTKGSQKHVFLASWRLHQRLVVAKRIAGPPKVAEKLVLRESQSHPLSIEHPNIIKTHLMANRHGEQFLVEEYVEALNDKTSYELEEAANLFFEITSALTYLHNRDLVHGDVKPDNIGRHGGRFLLLDFGICRTTGEFTREATATGSLRTRAPELLAADRYIEPVKADVWAIGATVFNTLCKRYPLFEMGEEPPKIFDKEARAAFEKKLIERADKDWGKWVNLTGLNTRIRDPIAAALEQDPKKRPSAEQLLQVLKAELGLHLRHADELIPFAPTEELRQLKEYLVPDVLPILPASQKTVLKERLSHLRTVSGISQTEIDAMMQSLT